ncbi:hypothetical protein LEP1GSC203_3587 [Leptospira terpstrae serovar Hualin str. LT 11-33 = ATCC 700639]|uniref:Uncharacterized protein n=1 Tax=Leptospira terpstrae serovar Hualin str. LT 11-33 = ATCC 700639 TaxID=1257025 RepID=N1VX54_9LEPT|nr:hypothetical protein LEP1GSC203_3587 [Leptospira terpstrae serovar Hualin str. LT 11-33 = ATCC 700639]
MREGFAGLGLRTIGRRRERTRTPEKPGPEGSRQTKEYKEAFCFGFIGCFL